MPSSKLDYLSKYYTSSANNNDENDGKKSKKKKSKKEKKSKKHSGKKGRGGGLIVDDDDDEWNDVMIKKEEEADDMDGDEEDRPIIVNDIPNDYDEEREDSSKNGNKPRGSWETVPVDVNSNGDAIKRESSPSPPQHRRRRRYDSESDDGNENANHKRRSASPSPTRRRYDSSSDEEGGGRPIKKEPSPSPNAHRRRRHDSDNDDNSSNGLNRHDSPPPQEEATNRAARRRRRYDSDDSDDNDRRRGRNDHSEPTRPIKRHDSSSEDESGGHGRGVGKRRRYDSDDDSDGRGGRKRLSSTRRRYDSDDDNSGNDDGKEKKDRMSSGHVAGLQNYRDFNKAEEKIQESKKRDAQLMVDKYGMGETTYRDEKGRKVDPAELAKKKKRDGVDPEVDRQLNTGKVQLEAQRAKQEEYQHLSQSSFARHVDDDRLEAMKKAEIRKDDPMAAFAARKQRREQQSKRAVDGSLAPARPVYKGPPPKPHRFGKSIRPGYRWDGVYRGNGFEDKLLASQFSAKRKQEAAYRWRSADM